MQMAPTTEHVTRLSLIRSLLQQAEVQVTAAPPKRPLALLSMHDAVEMFLDLVAEAANAPISSRKDFREYWRALAECVPAINLPLQRAMEKLNSARVALKHHGQRPSDDSIKAHLANVTSFLDETCSLVFGIELSQVSMALLIKNDEVRRLINEAYAALRVDDFQSALSNIALAFTKGFSYSRRTVHSHLIPLNFHFMGTVRGIDSDLSAAVADMLRPLSEAINKLSADYSRTIVLASLGIDLRNYEFFRSLTPIIHSFIGGMTREDWLHPPSDSKTDVEWCLDFVVDFMLRLEAPSIPIA